MQQDVRLFRQLGDAAVTYARARPMEYFGSVKRVFEFAMNTGRMDEARQILPEFRRSFSAVRRKLPALSHVSFAKNIGHFYLANGKGQAGLGVLRSSLQASEALNLHGQRRQILDLMNAGGSVSQAMPTFRVA